MSTSVVLLAYKEAENLKILLPQIHKVMEKLKDDYEVIVIDSAKPLDNTKEVCEKNNTLYYPQEGPCRIISASGQEETLLLQNLMRCHRKNADMRREHCPL